MTAPGDKLHVLILGIGGVTGDFAPNWPEPVLARALARRGHRVTAIGYLQPAHPSMRARREEIDGIDVLRAPPRIWPGPELGRLLDAIPRPDVLHIYHFRNVFVYNAVAWARRRGVPVVHTPVGPYHDAYLVDDRERPYASQVRYDRLAWTLPDLLRQLRRDPRPRRQLTNYLLHAPLRQVDRFIASSRAERVVLERMGFAPERIETIPLWIGGAPDLTPDDSVVRGLAHPIVLFIGQLTPRKGFDLLVEAMPAVVAQHPSATFVFVSHNPASQAEMEARARALGVAARLVFAGRVTEAQKLALLRAAACIAIPSRYEGFGLPLLEAMQAGVPLVASDIPVIDEIVRDGTDGLLVAPESPAALAAGIIRLLDDPALRARLAAGGRARLAAAFDEAALLERTLDCYARAAQARVL
jgi:glycosyltransferase involved in cell wall biosynthesis